MSVVISTLQALKSFVERIANVFGFQYVGIGRVPSKTMVGLKKYDFDTILDVGANEGQFARYAVQTFAGARVFAFEPLPEAFGKLKQWAARTTSRDIVCLNCAVGSESGMVNINRHIDFSPSSSLLSTTDACVDQFPVTKQQEVIQVECKTLDDAMESYAQNDFGNMLLKMDVQGFEDRVIAGGTDTVKKAKAILLEFSVEKLYDGQAEFSALVSLLQDIGFEYAGNFNQVYDKSDGSVVYVDCVFINQKK